MQDSDVHQLEKKDAPKESSQKTSSVVIEEVLNLTYPNYKKLFSFKKQELDQYIFDYFFNDDEEMFYKIGSFTNMMTACNLKGFQLIIQKNNLNSFEALDLHMMTKKARSFALLGSTLAGHEVLDEVEQTNIVGGRKTGLEQPIIPYNFYFYSDKSRIA